MTGTLDNIEPVARAICHRMIQTADPDADIPAIVERLWRVTAALLEAGLIDDEGNHLPHSLEQGEAAWHAWLEKNA